MATSLHFTFNTGTLGPMTGSIRIGFPQVIPSMTGSYFPISSGTVLGIFYDSFEGDLNRQVRADPAFALFTASYSNVTHKWTLSAGGTGFTASFNIPMSEVLGFDPGQTFQGTTLTSSRDPGMMFRSNWNARSNVKQEYEQDSGYTEHYADDGTPYSIGKLSASVFEDWTFSNEPVRKVYDRYRTNQTPFTWQRAVKHARSVLPWVLFETGSVTLNYDARRFTGRFTALGAKFEPREAIANYNGHWHIDIKAQILSRGSGSGG